MVSKPKTVVYLQATSEVGGSDIALYRLVTRLNTQRYRPVVVLPQIGSMGIRLRQAGIQVRTVPLSQLRALKSVNYQSRYLAGFWPSVLRVARLLRRERAELVHSNSLFALYGGWAALMLRIPHVWHIREIPDVPPTIQRGMGLLALCLSSRVVPISEAVSQLFPARARRSDKLSIIYDGIDLERFHPTVSGQRIRDDLNLKAGTPLVGFVARLDPWKGADVFVRAAAAVGERRPDAHFLVCGGELQGHERYADRVKDLTHQLGMAARIHFTGWRYQLDDIAEVMAAVDVFVHTATRPEPFGLVLVEAMATGKPVVAAKGGGVPEVVEFGVTGSLVQPGDWREYADRIVELLSDPSRAAEMGRAGRDRAERLFELGQYTARMQRVYDDVLGIGPPTVYD